MKKHFDLWGPFSPGISRCLSWRLAASPWEEGRLHRRDPRQGRPPHRRTPGRGACCPAGPCETSARGDTILEPILQTRLQRQDGHGLGGGGGPGNSSLSCSPQLRLFLPWISLKESSTLAVSLLPTTHTHFVPFSHLPLSTAEIPLVKVRSGLVYPPDTPPLQSLTPSPLHLLASLPSLQPLLHLPLPHPPRLTPVGSALGLDPPLCPHYAHSLVSSPEFQAWGPAVPPHLHVGAPREPALNTVPRGCACPQTCSSYNPLLG